MKWGNNRGAAYIEYAISLSILLVVLASAAIGFEIAARSRAEVGMRIAEEMVPCGGRLSGDECF